MHVAGCVDNILGRQGGSLRLHRDWTMIESATHRDGGLVLFTIVQGSGTNWGPECCQRWGAPMAFGMDPQWLRDECERRVISIISHHGLTAQFRLHGCLRSSRKRIKGSDTHNLDILM